MAAIPATHVPAGAPAAGGPPPAIRYATQTAWPGITGPLDARCWACTWAMRDGVYQVKYVSDACAVHRGGGHG